MTEPTPTARPPAEPAADGRARRVVAWWERHQVGLYLLGLGLGVLVGVGAPGAAPAAEVAVTPLLVGLLYATFLGVPFTRLGQALRDWRFLVAVLGLNFLVVPVVAFVLSRFVVHDPALLVGVLFVLLCPCVDYVLVFTDLAGGAKDRLLVAAPLLMVAQMVLLPLQLWLFAGREFVDTVAAGPFVQAFVTFIVVPLLAAWVTQLVAARTRRAQLVAEAVSAAMVPLMVVTLCAVVASQIPGVAARLGALVQVIPLYVAFAVVMVPVGMVAGRITGLDGPGRRALVFSGVTRNSLIVLPLVLALPPAFALAPLAVVTQTLVELVAMVAMVRLVPRLVPARPSARAR